MPCAETMLPRWMYMTQLHGAPYPSFQNARWLIKAAFRKFQILLKASGKTMLRQIWRKFRAIRSLSPAITGVVIFIIVAGCHNDKDSGFNEGSSEKTVSLTFELVLNPLVYQNSAWG